MCINVFYNIILYVAPEHAFTTYTNLYFKVVCYNYTAF